MLTLQALVDSAKASAGEIFYVYCSVRVIVQLSLGLFSRGSLNAH